MNVRRTGRDLARGGRPERVLRFSVLRTGMSTDVTLAIELAAAELARLGQGRPPAAALADRPAGNEARFVLPVTLRAYGGQMLRPLGQDQEFAARHKRRRDDRRPHQGSPAGK